MIAGGSSIPEIFDLEETRPPVFYGSLEEVNEHSGEYPDTHVIRRAWKKMKLSGVFCVEKRPTVYFKEVNSYNDVDAKRLHHQFWNQGVATLLVIVSPTEVRVFSSMARPAMKNEPLDGEGRLVETLNRTADVLKLRNLMRRVQTGSLYQDKSESFGSECAVDTYLLGNLKSARKRLLDRDGGLEMGAVHALLGRILLTSYLVHRKIIGEYHFRKAGAPPGVNSLQQVLSLPSPNAAKKVLFNLFALLQERFNGSMFDDSVGEEREKISDEHISVLRSFLKGDEVGTGQYVLPFWSYDFSVIPIETISAIYEDFLAAEDESGKRDSGAYYTPKHLAEMVVDVALDGWKDLLGKRFLDPACGSGIFLVILFNRLAEEWRRKNPGKRNLTRAKALIEILQTHLCGVDKEETACRIACFSLYLALLDQLDPPDIKDLEDARGKVLPNLLSLEDDCPSTTDPRVIYHGDFFSRDIPRDFDLVIGNPPWTGRKKKETDSAKKWCFGEDDPYLPNAPRKVAERERYFIPGGQIAHAFMWKAPVHLKDNGLACLLMTAKVLLNRTDEFQSGWFSEVTVQKIVQLADWRHILFEHAICPAMIVRFAPRKPSSPDYSIEYDVPKVDRVDPRRGVISILPEDQKRIRISEILAFAEGRQAPSLWKRKLWETPRDEQLLRRLLAMPRLGCYAGKTSEGKRWICAQGFQPFNEEERRKYGGPRKRWWTDEHLFVSAGNPGIDLILDEYACREIGAEPEYLRYDRDKVIFAPPMVLVNQGLSRKAFCDFPVLFQHALQSITGPSEDEPVLMFLSAVLNSPVADYVLFHTAANWGTERTKVHLWELLAFPFAVPEDTTNRDESQAILQKVMSRMRILRDELTGPLVDREDRIRRAKRDVEPLIYDYYQISKRERMLIEDTIEIIEPSSTPNRIGARIPTLADTDRSKRTIYADLLCEVLNTWAKRGQFKVSAYTTIDTSLGLGILTLTKSKTAKTYDEPNSPKDLTSALDRIYGLLREPKGHFSYRRSLKVFDADEPQIHIVKPLTYRHWTRTAALNDADEIAASILSGRVEE